MYKENGTWNRNSGREAIEEAYRVLHPPDPNEPIKEPPLINKLISTLNDAIALSTATIVEPFSYARTLTLNNRKKDATLVYLGSVLLPGITITASLDSQHPLLSALFLGGAVVALQGLYFGSKHADFQKKQRQQEEQIDY